MVMRSALPLVWRIGHLRSKLILRLSKQYLLFTCSKFLTFLISKFIDFSLILRSLTWYVVCRYFCHFFMIDYYSCNCINGLPPFILADFRDSHIFGVILINWARLWLLRSLIIRWLLVIENLVIAVGSPGRSWLVLVMVVLEPIIINISNLLSFCQNGRTRLVWWMSTI